MIGDRLKKNVRRALVLLIVVVTGTTGLPTAYAATDASLSITSSTVNIGSTTQLVISLNPGTYSVDEVQVQLSFPTDKVLCSSITNSSGFPIVPGTDTCGSSVDFRRARGSGYTSSATVASVTFQTVGAGTANINFTASSYGSSVGTQVPTVLSSGTITINDPNAPPPGSGSSGSTGTSTSTGAGGTTTSSTRKKSTTQATQAAPAQTPANTADTTAPSITKFEVKNLKTGQPTVSWITDEPATSEVEYGLTTKYGSKVTSTKLSTTHEVKLDRSKLKPGQKYHLRVKSVDAAGNVTMNKDQIFQMPVAAPASSSSKHLPAVNKAGLIILWSLVVLVIGFIGWFLVLYIRQRRSLAPEMVNPVSSLETPPQPVETQPAKEEKPIPFQHDFTDKIVTMPTVPIEAHPPMSPYIQHHLLPATTISAGRKK